MLRGMPAAEIAVLGLAIGKLLLRCADLNDSADALEDAGAAARALKVLRSGKRRDQVTQVVSELIDDRLGGVSDPTRREQMRIAAGNVATVFDGLTDDALRQAAQDPEAFPAWVLSGPGRSLVASTEEALTPPRREAMLAAAARAYAQDMATRNYFHHDHTDLQGRKPSQRVEAAGYTGWRRVTENIAAGVTVKTVVNEWIASETHCVNLMDPNLKEVGIGLTTSRTSTYGTYFVQDFGTR